MQTDEQRPKESSERVVKHLEMIQGVITRLGHNSFLIKGWSMAILAAGVIFVARAEVQAAWMVLAFLVPVAGFWVLDAYYLRQERLFRAVYDEVRKQTDTDFAMQPERFADCSNCSWLAVLFSQTLCIFYAIEAVFVLSVFFVLQCMLCY